MFSVVTPRICVSPRWNSAEPCTRGSTSTSAERVRMSASPRPSMRTFSRRMRWRTSFLFSARKAGLISSKRSSKRWPRVSLICALSSSSFASRSCLSAMVSAPATSAEISASTASYTSSE